MLISLFELFITWRIKGPLLALGSTLRLPRIKKSHIKTFFRETLIFGKNPKLFPKNPKLGSHVSRAVLIDPDFMVFATKTSEEQNAITIGWHLTALTNVPPTIFFKCAVLYLNGQNNIISNKVLGFSENELT